MLARDLLPLLLQHIDAAERPTVRGWCSSARRAFDCWRPVLSLRDDRRNGAGGPSLDCLLSAATGILRRGCTPQRVELSLSSGPLEELRRYGAALLQAFADAGFGRPGGCRGPSVLVLNAPLLSPSIARAIASAFPALEELRLVHRGPSGPDYREGVTLLLGAGGAGTEEHAGGEEGSAPLLPQLVRARLLNLRARGVAAACVAALSASTTLRELEADLGTRQPAVAADLARMTQLRALTLRLQPGGGAGAGPAPLLAPVLAALTGLTQLSLCGLQLQLQGAAFAGLAALRRLELADVDLGVGGLAALRSLTSLTARTLLPPPGGALQGPGAPAAASWPLPPQLRVLRLEGRRQPIEVLAALRPPAGLACRVQGDCVQVVRGRHTAADNALLPAAEAALCAALRLLAPSAEAIGVEYVEGEYGLHGRMAPGLRLLRPVAGAPASIGQRRVGPQHGAWLAALASPVLKQLRLVGIRLSVLDLKTIAQCLPGLEVLCLKDPTTYPLYALPHLAGGLPRLARLELGATPFAMGMPEATAALSSLLTDPRFGGKVCVEDRADAEEGLAMLLLNLMGRMEEAGVDPLRFGLC